MKHQLKQQTMQRMLKQNRVPAAFIFLCVFGLASILNAGGEVSAIRYYTQAFPADHYISVVPAGETFSGIEQISSAGGEPVAPEKVPVQGSCANVHTDTIDGVVFSLAIEKKTYKPGDSLRARFLIRNRTMATVVYDFTSSCMFELQVAGSRGNSIYSFLEKQACKPQPSRIALAPSAEKVMEFPSVPLVVKQTDSLTIKAAMAGYPLSSVQAKAAYKAAIVASGPVALEGSRSDKPVVEFNREKKMLVIRIEHAQRLTISAFVLTGKKMNKLSVEKFLAPGTHLINFNNRKLADGVVIFKVEGAGFSESKTINLAR